MTPAPQSSVLEKPVSQTADNGTGSNDAEVLVLDELLVEEISIDGMCGVY